MRDECECGNIFEYPEEKAGQTIVCQNCEKTVLLKGNLHDGHLSLIREAQLHNEFVICSIFINPTQFNNENDFNSYPKTIDDDISKLENIGCNALFLPEVQEIYPKGLAKKKIVNNFRNILCDKLRPGHFD